MRVLYVIDSLMPGGAETSLAAMAPHLRSAGVALEVAYLQNGWGLQPELEAAGAVLFDLSGTGGRPGWFSRVKELARARRPDLVHTTLFESDIVGRTAAAVAGLPVVSSLVNIAYGRQHRDDPGLRTSRVVMAQLTDAATARLVTRFHAVSRHVADAMSRRLAIRRTRIEVIPRGRDPALLGTRTPERRSAVRSRLEIPPGTALVLAAARHERQKGLDVLIEAMPAVLRRIPALLLVAGREGNQSEALRGLVTRHGLEPAVRFLGARDDVADLLCAADAFAFPSRWEGLPGAVLEAMALGAPIVSADIGPVRELVDEQHALLVPPDRPEVLAEALIAALEDRDAAAERAHAAHARFMDNFTVDRAAERMVTLYERALSETRRRTSAR
jgi:glycosyltransferase involved in cell wall biosynthesis